jgi:hypothetical protein
VKDEIKETRRHGNTEIWRREATRMGRTERGDKECAAKDMGQGIKDNSGRAVL